MNLEVKPMPRRHSVESLFFSCDFTWNERANERTIAMCKMPVNVAGYRVPCVVAYVFFVYSLDKLSPIESNERLARQS